jgi:hypothetical protein
MFESASSFNQDISGWNVRNGCDLYGMFQSASSFQQNLNKWRLQLSTKALCPYSVYIYDMFLDSNCTIPTDPVLPAGSMCKERPTVCLRKAFENHSGCCKDRSGCLQDMKSSCRQVFLDVGQTLEDLRERAKIVYDKNC